MATPPGTGVVPRGPGDVVLPSTGGPAVEPRDVAMSPAAAAAYAGRPETLDERLQRAGAAQTYRR